MADPFELWRLMWLTAISRGLESLAEAAPNAAALEEGHRADTIDLSCLTTLGRIRVELPTMLLLERNEPVAAKAEPVLIVAPYAIHEASIADFADRHSVAQIVAEGGSEFVALTYWKSATAQMRDYGIDAYLSDLNVAVDDLGGEASLVGLCQGGWLAAAYAARFPLKVAKLVLAGAPIDTGAAQSRITRTLVSVSTESISQALALAGGRVRGSLSYALWSDHLTQDLTAEAALQDVSDAALVEKFKAWESRTVNLPGAYFSSRRNGYFAKTAWRAARFRASDGSARCPTFRPRSSPWRRLRTRSSRFRKRPPSSRYARARTSKSASSRVGISRCSWAGERSRPPGGTSRTGSRSQKRRPAALAPPPPAHGNLIVSAMRSARELPRNLRAKSSRARIHELDQFDQTAPRN